MVLILCGVFILLPACAIYGGMFAANIGAPTGSFIRPVQGTGQSSNFDNLELGKLLRVRVQLPASC